MEPANPACMMVPKKLVLQIILSLGTSLLLIGLLLRVMTGSVDQGLLPRLVSLFRETAPVFVCMYAFSGLCQTWLRAVRYRCIIRATGEEPPAGGHMFLVAMSRNMFVDMLPARMGELSYIGMLNRGYRVSGEACLSSLAISFVFDFVALAVLLICLLVYQVATGGLQSWLLGSTLAVLGLCALFLGLLFPIAARFRVLFVRLAGSGNILVQKAASLAVKTVDALQQTGKAGITFRVFVLSLAIRSIKYLGLYLLFLGVVGSGRGDMDTSLPSVLIALVSGEAAASLPLPTFMSFGTYEAGGALALLVLGASRTRSVLVMLALHLWSQVVDYSLGTLAFVVFLFRSRVVAVAEGGREGRIGWRWLVPAVILLVAGLVVMIAQVRGIRKLGALKPPPSGRPVEGVSGGEEDLGNLHGFVVWSSNRFGNHDIVMLSLPERKLTRLTDHPHTEYFPRISPDGKKIVFCRSQTAWVSQRNPVPWDVYLLDLESGQVRLLARNGNVPTWSADGRHVYFQRQANRFVRHTLATGEETLLFETGGNLPLPASVILETPSWNGRQKKLAVTLRGSQRGTVIIDRQRRIRRIGGGCELTWSADGSFLYQIDHGGRGGNTVYRVDADSLQRQPWFDADSEYSHEYFPRLDRQGRYLVYGASTGGHEHDTADYEIFLWKVGSSFSSMVRLSYHTGNDCWPDIYLYE